MKRLLLIISILAVEAPSAEFGANVTLIKNGGHTLPVVNGDAPLIGRLE